MTLRFPPLCHLCKHLRYDEEWRIDRPTPVRCAAYPDGIPDAIFLNLGDHRKPRRGDHGIQFELAPKFTQADVEWWVKSSRRISR